MKKTVKDYIQAAKSDIPSSIVVFLVALPLCMGIALASGVPLFSGLVSGIVGGLVIGSLSRSDLSVSGPAAGLVVIVLNAVDSLGSIEAFVLAVVLAGILQLVLGFAKAGLIGMYFPSSVIKGMLAAIGLILILKQIPHLVGFDVDAFGEMEFMQQDGTNTLSALVAAFEHVYVGSLIVGMISLLLLILWEQPAIKKMKAFKLVPGAVAVVIIGVLINYLFRGAFPDVAIGKSHLVNLPSISGMESLKSVLIFPDWSQLANFQVYITAITIAIVASLETLLSIEAVDKLDPHKRHTPKNAELKAQGTGNIVAGLIGGLPITAVIVRSTANLDSGAKTKMSAVYHGFWLVLAVIFFPFAMNEIPLASLAAILIMVGYKLNKPGLYKYHFKQGREQFIPFIVTVLAILFTDLLIGIIIGICVGVFFILKANYKRPYYYSEEKDGENGDHVIRIKLSEHVSFLNKASLSLTLDHLPENRTVIIDGSHTQDIHHDALEVIHDFETTAEEKNIKLILKNIPRLITDD